ncbi:hypothetical protein GCM10027298_38540 [Epidermidibacterium keratini]
MEAVAAVADALERRLGVEAAEVGIPVPSAPANWDIELMRCRDGFQRIAQRIDAVLAAGHVPVSAITRCAVALATQPAVVRHHPEAVVLWFDAHGDINVPADSPTGYLGGMALSGPLGWWDSGFGAGLPATQAILVGSRDLDAAEQERV